MHTSEHNQASSRHHMTDADRVKDCLCSSKERAKFYAHAALECTNNGVREFFLAFHGEETWSAEFTFSFLHTRGGYPVVMAQPERISEVRRQFQAVVEQMALKGRPSARRYETAHPTHVQWQEAQGRPGDRVQ